MILMFSFTLLIAVLTSCEESVLSDREKKEYRLRVGELRFSVGDDLDETVKRLGEYNSFKSTPSCASDGFDEMYVYNGFRIMGSRSDGKCLITKIELTNDSIRTAENVGVGDNVERVTAVYGKESLSSMHAVEYVGENCRLQFYHDDGRVVSIKYVEK